IRERSIRRPENARLLAPSIPARRPLNMSVQCGSSSATVQHRWEPFEVPTGREAAFAMKGDKGRLVTLFLCGDVMSGRGIEQILPHPSDPCIHEAFVSDARTYVALAEEVNGPIP